MHHAHPIRTARVAFGVALSLAVHAIAVLVLALFVPCQGDSAEFGVREFGVVAVVPVRPPVEPEPERPPAHQLQHVAIAEPDDASSEPPEDARFADRVDRAVDRETVSAEASRAPGAAIAISSRAAQRGVGDAEGSRTVRPRLSTRADGATDDPAAGELQPMPESLGGVPTDIDPDAVAEDGRGIPEAPSPRGGGLDLSIFNPSAGDPILIDGGGLLDHLELDEGERTLVNSERSLYWSFFERMRRQIAAEWDPNGVYRRHDPSGQLYRRVDRYTVLSMTLGPDGALREASVYRASGLDFLDEEAVRALRAAAPFRNVPEGLKDERGLVELRFGFILTFDGRSRLRRIPL